MREYQDSGGNLAVLNEAEDDLTAAVEADPEFLPAIYFRGITRDLKGETDAAIADLERVVNSEPTFTGARFNFTEARFNLGVACFHKYHEQNLKRAESEFEAVLSATHLSENLRLQACASLAQTWAQLMIQREPENVDFAAVKSRLGDILESTTIIQQSLEGKTIDPQVAWRLENSLGLGLMFASDYLEAFRDTHGQPLRRHEMLHLALQRFTAADQINPDNWAVMCNLESIWMRRAYWRRQGEASLGDDAFQRSFNYLNHVIEVLRPKYGFALYEIGRLHRLTGRFDEALKWLRRAETVPESKRDVSSKTLNREIMRAREHSDQFP